MKVKIGVTDYELVMDDTAVLKEAFDAGQEEERDKDYYIGGMVNTMMNTVHINKEYPLQTKTQSFFHECLHAMLDEIGQDELYCDEPFVDSLSKQIYGLFMNNDLGKIINYLDGKKNAKSR